MALVIVIIVLIGTLAFFHLKCSFMRSLATVWSALLAMIITFSYYEILAEQFISRGYAVQWIQFGCFLVIYIISFAVLRSVSEILIGANIDLGDMVKIPTAIICGLITGFIFSGMLLVALGLLPMHGKLFYSRFDPKAAVNPEDPKKPVLNADGFVSGFYSWISSGALCTDTSFGVLHADYLTQIHLNKLKAAEVLPVCGRDAISFASAKTQKPIRQVENGKYTVIRIGIDTRKINSGGASGTLGKVDFFPAQIRMITKDSGVTGNLMAGSGKVFYPVGIWKDQLQETPLGEIIPQDSLESEDRKLWLDLAFEIPEGQVPVLLQFKQNAMVKVPSIKTEESPKES
jgi:hypothetical protein